MQNVLVAFDFSKNAIEALKYGIDICKEYNTQLNILHVYNLPPFERYMSKNAVEEMEEGNMLNHFRTFTETEVLNAIEATDELSINYVLKKGSTSNQIIDVAKATKPILIIMGAHGMSGIQKMVWGSNTQKVVQKTEIPVLVIPNETSFKTINNIVFATDFNVEDFEIIDSLIRFTSVIESNLSCVHIRESYSDWDTPTINYIKDKYKDAIQQGALNIELVENSDVTDGLNEYIEANNVDVLAILKEEQNMFNRIFDKSYTKELLEKCKIPLMIFKETIE